MRDAGGVPVRFHTGGWLDGWIENVMSRVVEGKSRGSVESGALLRLYRRALPLSFREAVAARIEPETRNRIVSAIASFFSGARSRISALALLPARRAALDEFRIVRTGSRAYLCRPIADCTAAAAAQENLDRVCAALEAAGVRYIRIRPKQYQRTGVAIRAVDRGQATSALEAVLRRSPAYAAPVARDGSQREEPILVRRGSSLRRFRSQPVIRIAWYRISHGGHLRYGLDLGCDVEFWGMKDGMLSAAQPNRVLGVLEPEFTTVDVGALAFTSFVDPYQPSRLYPTHSYVAQKLIDQVTFPIDAVFTWVNGSDPEWNARRMRALTEKTGLAPVNSQAANHARYATRDELRYSLRSVMTYAPWIRHIYLVTDDQIPVWLDPSHPRISVVSHRELFGDRGLLPTFNSHAIESQLHHIDGLSEHFLYFNDDVFLGRPQPAETFFHANGMTKFFPSKALLPMGPRLDDESPAAIAGKNNRLLLEQLTGRVVVAKMRHVPHALTKSVLFEIGEKYADLVAKTAAHQFRHPDDISIASAFAHYYAYGTCRATPHGLEYDYADLAQRSTPRRLSRFLDERSLDVFCLNDTVSSEDELERQTRLLNWFLEAYFPVPSPFEKDRRETAGA